ncbi:Predicted exporter of the RND superfamily [uncultured Gammaproteobacteria bacterium]|nr:Exporter protein, RND family [uncultured Gammaproteobacteria bacterium]CAC9473805.1 Exporter protein, RND family [uncultured Gammaproteobacteria bacterium]VVH66829.1 Predicted exporter of the RND superfamily [uncultured Gammaproteobacteria bacterium]
MNWRAKIEQKFEHLADFIFENSKKTILAVLLVVATLGSNLPNLKIDTSTEGFLHKTDELRIKYDEFRDQFGRDEKILIAVETQDIFDLDFLKKLAKLHQELENNLPYIEAVNSLINARNTLGTEDSLIVGDLFDDYKIDQSTLSAKKQLASANPLLKDLLFNGNKTFTNIIIDTQTYSSFDKNGKKIVINEADEFAEETIINDTPKLYLTDTENTKIIEVVQQITKKYEDANFKVYLAGSALFSGVIKQAMKKDTRSFIQKMLLMVILILALMFRRISGVVLPIITVTLTIISAVSLMALLNAPFTVVTQIMPSFLLAVITGASIHLLAIFYKDFAKTGDKKSALRFAMGHSGFAIVMTSLTTAAGMWSFAFSDVAPVADLGIFASASIALGLLFVLIFLPAMLATLKLKHKPVASHNKTMDTFLYKIADFSLTHAKSIVITSAIIIVVAIFFAAQMQFSHHPLIWFKADNPVRVSVETIDKELNGSMTLEIIVDTGRENGLYEPEMLQKIERTTDYLNALKNGEIFVGKTITLVDVLKETNKALNANDAAFYKIPTNKDLIAQELFLFTNSGSDDLEDFVDSGFSKARITVKVPFVDAIKYNHFLSEVKTKISQEFGADANVSFTGISILLASIMEKSIHSSAISYILAFGLIAIMMIILIGNIKIGLISMIPNILPMLSIAALMVGFGVPFDMFSMLVGAIALGLAVDDTVHFMHNFNRYRLEGKNVDEATRLTLVGTGRAIIITSIVLSLGFLVLLSASMTNMLNFGVLTASAIFVALIADLLLVPAIMKLLEKK